MRPTVDFVLLFFLCLLSATSTVAKSLGSESDDNPDLPDADLLLQEFLETIENAVNHIVLSRDMHKLVREKRQLNNFGGGSGFGGAGFGQGSFGGANFGQGSFGGGFGQSTSGLFGAGTGGAGGFGSGNFLDSLSNVVSSASLGSLGAGAAPGSPVLSGIGQANNVVKTVVGLDRMRCSSRLACEFLANRGLFNRSSAIVPTNVLPNLPNGAQGALNISHPSTFRSILGILQLMRFQEFGAYEPLEAALWGAAHRDHSRCRSQFTKCPSTAEAFITELNSTPGGLQSMLSNTLQTIRNTLPGSGSDSSGLETAANVADLSSLSSLSSFGQQTGAGALGSLAGLGNNQFQFNPGSSQFGGGQQFLNPGSQFGGNQQFLNPGSQFGSNQQFLNPGSSQFGSNQQFLNPSSSLLGGISGSQFGSGQQFLNPSLLGGNQQFLNPSSTQFGAGQQFLNPSSSALLSGSQQFLNPGSSSVLGGISGINSVSPIGGSLSSAGINGLGSLNGVGGVNNLASFGGLGASSGVGSLNGLGGVSSGFGGVNGLGSTFNGLNNFVGAAGLNAGSQFSSQFPGQGFGSLNGLSGNFRSGDEEKKDKNKNSKWKWSA